MSSKQAISIVASIPSRTGAIADIYKCSSPGALIALKFFRCNASTNKNRFNEMILRQVLIWRKLNAHPNILHVSLFHDVQDSPFSAVISPWQENGNLSQYLRRYPEADRLSLMVQASDALSFLHTKNFVHGGLHPGNLLVSDSGDILLSDFSLANLKNELQSSELDLDHIRYMPPDHLVPDAPPTPAFDCFSFGSVCFETLSKSEPFANYPSNVDVVLALHNGEPPFDRPPKRTLMPPQLDDALWDLMSRCWDINPAERPDMSYVNETLRAIHSQISKVPLQARL